MPFKSKSQERFLWMRKKQGKLPGVNLHEWADKTGDRKLPEHVADVKKESAMFRHGYLIGYLKKQAGTSSETAASEMNTSQDSVGPSSPALRSPLSNPEATNAQAGETTLRGPETGQYVHPREVVKHQTLPAMDTGSAPGDATPLAFTMSP